MGRVPGERAGVGQLGEGRLGCVPGRENTVGRSRLYQPVPRGPLSIIHARQNIIELRIYHHDQISRKHIAAETECTARSVVAFYLTSSPGTREDRSYSQGLAS